ncbi:GGDEF domain-containing protein [Candidatus Saccharibacteria bacterium]|nr:GGDEF domain-containing protein [Candidatus Saccharibacteria bacterium]
MSPEQSYPSAHIDLEKSTAPVDLLPIIEKYQNEITKLTSSLGISTEADALNRLKEFEAILKGLVMENAIQKNSLDLDQERWKEIDLRTTAPNTTSPNNRRAEYPSPCTNKITLPTLAELKTLNCLDSSDLERIVELNQLFSFIRSMSDEAKLKLMQLAPTVYLMYSIILDNINRAISIDPTTSFDAKTPLTLPQLDAMMRSEETSESNFHCAAIFIDFENLKGINDAIGHRPTDEILYRGIFVKFLEGIRSTDVCIRWGGDEFVIFLTSQDNPDLEFNSFLNMVASKVDLLSRIKISEATLSSGEVVSDLDAGFTIGVAAIDAIKLGDFLKCHPRHPSDTLIGAADRAMYQAKSSNTRQPKPNTTDSTDPFQPMVIPGSKIQYAIYSA